MTKDAIECHVMPQNKLSPKQLNAIELLAVGKNSSEVAQALDVDRKTIYRWKTKNPFFIAELNERIRELWLTAKERLNSLVNKAVDVLSQSLEAGDSKAAVEILKATDIYGKVGSPSKDTNAYAVMSKQAGQFAKDLFFCAPSQNPADQLASAQNILPVLTVERYWQLREEWEKKIEEDNYE